MTLSHRRAATGNALSACLLMTLMTLMTFVRPAAGADDADATVHATLRFDLPAQPLDTALVAFGEATGYSVLVSSTLAAGRVAASVRGDYTPAEALQRLLAGTQLGARFSGSRAFTLLALADAPVASAPVPAEAVPAAPPLQGYAAILQRSLTRALCRLHPDAFGRYRLAFQLWLDERGRVRAVHVLEPSGVAQRDHAVLQRLRSLLMDGAPPAGLPQPLTILLTPRPDPDADCAPYLTLAGAP
ncbi:secretin and TonB N-terminal domain-containing protein [Janthinobacterium sp. UMAB-56]|uniref:secretin and TonB N-terminal domain-containing protein n=1 Tax=Janthinobacterium sp. UMAB-56 TaxID=1365361 RepID=UPI001C56EFC2|nr:secretin and TonB N-terminal domain-containing protein [Janthinobacterium sp. UMAB-56]